MSSSAWSFRVSRLGSELTARERLLALVGLENAADQYPHQLSGGMQQRIGLARALAIDPAILLMDEPFSALDAQTREVLQAELLRIHAQTGKTTLFVTHDLDEAIYLSDRVVVLAAKPGRVKQVIDIPFAYPQARAAGAAGQCAVSGDPRDHLVSDPQFVGGARQ